MLLRRTLPTLILAIVILLANGQPGLAQEQDRRYFPETGHWVAGEFLAAYETPEDPLLLYGPPITDAFPDPLTGVTVQYFQRGRFELHPDAPQGQQVQLSPLGELLYQPGQPTVPLDPKACRYFPQQQHSVCYAFLTFYDANGGAGQFGGPLSDLEREDDLYVQYFQKARFEWHPEAPAGQRVILSDLGRVYFDRVVGDDHYTRPSPNDNLPAGEIRLGARAFAARAVVSPGSRQVIYVVVQDQYLRPVAGVNVSLTAHFPGGAEEHYRPAVTDTKGITQVEIPVGNLPYDRIVEIQAEAVLGELRASTGTWFRIWW